MVMVVLNLGEGGSSLGRDCYSAMNRLGRANNADLSPHAQNWQVGMLNYIDAI